MDIVEQALLDLGFPSWWICSKRFTIVKLVGRVPKRRLFLYWCVVFLGVVQLVILALSALPRA